MKHVNDKAPRLVTFPQTNFSFGEQTQCPALLIHLSQSCSDRQQCGETTHVHTRHVSLSRRHVRSVLTEVPVDRNMAHDINQCTRCH
eukprot:6222451-Amphidinium_carterae.2